MSQKHFLTRLMELAIAHGIDPSDIRHEMLLAGIASRCVIFNTHPTQQQLDFLLEMIDQTVEAFNAVPSEEV